MRMMVRAALTFGAAVIGSALPATAQTECQGADGARRSVTVSTGIAMTCLEVGPPKAVVLMHGLTDKARSGSTRMDSLHRLNPGRNDSATIRTRVVAPGAAVVAKFGG